MSVAVASGWVITWVPEPGKRTLWTTHLFPTRALAWEYIVKDAREVRGWRQRDIKAALARQGVRVMLGTLRAHWHIQHKQRDAGVSS